SLLSLSSGEGPLSRNQTTEQGGGVPMEGNSTSSVKTITLLFIGGAVLGTVAGMLLAPKAGRETRREIKHYAIKMKKDVASTAQRTKAGIEAALEKGRALLTESKAA